MQPLLVIGAGPVGLAVAKALGEVVLDYVQVEATDHVGGNWAHGVYTTAHIISSKKTTEYADFPMPTHYPDFPSASQMRAYFESYADAFQLRARIRFDTHLWQGFAPSKAHGAKASAYAYCRETILPGSAFHARMFVAATPSYDCLLYTSPSPRD